MLSRSKSAPKPLSDLAPPVSGRPRLPRSRTALSLNTSAATPLATPWEAREDPFSLVGFFPSRPAEVQEDWDWIRAHEEEWAGEEDGEEAGAHPEPAAAGQHKQEDNYDEYAQQVIDEEDKFGMLAFSSENIPALLRSKMPMFERPMSPVHVSPLAVDEPLDLDALHTKHCSRRETLGDGEAGHGPEIGQLFFFSGEEEKTEGSSWGWSQTIYAGLARLVGGQ